MRNYQIRIEDGDDFLKVLKIESAKAEVTMTEFLKIAVQEKINRTAKQERRNAEAKAEVTGNV